MDLFLYDIGLRHERVKWKLDFLCSDYYHYYFTHIQVPEKSLIAISENLKKILNQPEYINKIMRNL